MRRIERARYAEEIANMVWILHRKRAFVAPSKGLAIAVSVMPHLAGWIVVDLIEHREFVESIRASVRLTLDHLVHIIRKHRPNAEMTLWLFGRFEKSFISSLDEIGNEGVYYPEVAEWVIANGLHTGLIHELRWMWNRDWDLLRELLRVYPFDYQRDSSWIRTMTARDVDHELFAAQFSTDEFIIHRENGAIGIESWFELSYLELRGTRNGYYLYSIGDYEFAPAKYPKRALIE